MCHRSVTLQPHLLLPVRPAANSSSPHSPPTATGFKTPGEFLPIPTHSGLSPLLACLANRANRSDFHPTETKETLLQIPECRFIGPPLTLLPHGTSVASPILDLASHAEATLSRVPMVQAAGAMEG